jgi:hypothetical protein
MAADVPSTLSTRGSRFVAGGFIVRDLLLAIASDALNDVQARNQKNENALAEAKRKLAEVEAALATF